MLHLLPSSIKELTKKKKDYIGNNIMVRGDSQKSSYAISRDGLRNKTLGFSRLA